MVCRDIDWASGGAGHGGTPEEVPPPDEGTWRREASGETPGNASETRPLHLQ